jgi:uncharacterized glyoxalase superfamily metalloenzyme YdcJ
MVRIIVTIAEQGAELTPNQAADLIKYGLETFRWHREARVEVEVYKRLYAVNPLIADIVSFRGPHINHLTPRVLDIDTAQREMVKRG